MCTTCLSGSSTLLKEMFALPVMHAPLKMLQHLEDIELQRCGLGISSTSPGPIERLADVVSSLPHLHRLDLARNELGDGDALFLLGGTSWSK